MNEFDWLEFVERVKQIPWPALVLLVGVFIAWRKPTPPKRKTKKKSHG